MVLGRLWFLVRLVCFEELLGVCEGDGVRARRIPVDYASHSPQIEEIRGELLEVCVAIVPCSGEVPFFSTVWVVWLIWLSWVVSIGIGICGRLCGLRGRCGRCWGMGIARLWR